LRVQSPDQPLGIAPFGLALNDERVTTDGELIAGARARDLARAHLERRGLGADAGLAEADDGVGRLAMTRTPTGSPPAGVYTASIPNAANVASTAPSRAVISEARSKLAH
jgi:hypothetical protein